MKFFNFLLVLMASSATTETFNQEQFAQDYFAAWTASQAPDATVDDLEHYLSFLADDVGHQHLPFDSDDSREKGNKQGFREGMTFYLGSHTEYDAELVNTSHAKNLIIIEYRYQAKGIRPGTEQEVEIKNHNIEVLEIENGKISVIRKYNK